MRGYALRTKWKDVVFQFTPSCSACCSTQDVQKQIRTKLDSYYTLQPLHNYDPVRSEKDCFIVKALQSAYEQVNGLDGIPIVATGGTYAKVVPDIVPFGPSFPGQKEIGYQPDEWMDIKDIIMSAKVHASSLHKLAK